MTEAARGTRAARALTKSQIAAMNMRMSQILFHVRIWDGLSMSGDLASVPGCRGGFLHLGAVWFLVNHTGAHEKKIMDT